MSALRNKSRGRDPALGEYVIVESRTRDGDRDVWTRSLFVPAFPREQHPRHPTGYDPATGRRNACVSPSCSFYDELCRIWLAGFKWRPREKVT